MIRHLVGAFLGMGGDIYIETSVVFDITVGTNGLPPAQDTWGYVRGTYGAISPAAPDDEFEGYPVTIIRSEPLLGHKLFVTLSDMPVDQGADFLRSVEAERTGGTHTYLTSDATYTYSSLTDVGRWTWTGADPQCWVAADDTLTHQVTLLGKLVV